MVGELLEYILCRVNPFVPANADPKPVEVRRSERGYDALDAVVAVGRSSEPPRNHLEFVAERIVDENQTSWSVGSLAKDLLDGGARDVHEGFCSGQ